MFHWCYGGSTSDAKGGDEREGATDYLRCVCGDLRGVLSWEVWTVGVAVFLYEVSRLEKSVIFGEWGEEWYLVQNVVRSEERRQEGEFRAKKLKGAQLSSRN